MLTITVLLRISGISIITVKLQIEAGPNIHAGGLSHLYPIVLWYITLHLL